MGNFITRISKRIRNTKIIIKIPEDNFTSESQSIILKDTSNITIKHNINIPPNFSTPSLSA